MIGIITDPHSGGTFLQWTLSWLSGHDVVDNPLQKSNAHGYRGSQAHTLEQYQIGIQSHPHTFYLHPFGGSYYHPVVYDNDFAFAVTELETISDACVAISVPNSLYYCKQQPREWGRAYQTWQLEFEDQMRSIIPMWDKLNRDKQCVAISKRVNFLEHVSVLPYISNRTYVLDAFEFYTDFDVKSVCKLLGIKPKRLDHWHSVYRQWRTVHADRIQFATTYSPVDDIVREAFVTKL